MRGVAESIDLQLEQEIIRIERLDAAGEPYGV